MEIHLLDMGTTKFGDSILIIQGNRRIMIDGAHPGDSNSIRMQLQKLLGAPPPFVIDLLIVTHCHSDHIGCLPDLIKLGDIKPKMALLADEKLGFGSVISAQDSLTDGNRTLQTALQEEDHTDLLDDDMEQFLFDAANLQTKYHEMVTQLKTELKSNLLIFTGIEDGYASLEKKFEDFGLKILGPTKAHLKICGDFLANASGGAAGPGDALPKMDANNLSAIAKAYVSITNKRKQDSIADAEDMVGPGAAKNDESIVISVEEPGLKALLTGDMQLGLSEVAGLNTVMDQLLTTINAAGPYDFIKLAHHTSYNGLGHDGHVLDEWLKNTSLYAHSGGLHDTTHPDPEMLDLLKARKDQLFYARTDRNGIITVQKKKKPEMLISKGNFNDFTINKKIGDEPAVVTQRAVQPPQTLAKSEQAVIAPNLLESMPAVTSTSGIVEVITRIPDGDTKVTVMIDIDKKKAPVTPVEANNNGAQIDRPPAFAPGRLDGLVFLTCSEVLNENIGELETSNLLIAIKQIPNTIVVDIRKAQTADQAATQLRPKLNAGLRGIVIIGGYDVIPPLQLDVLTKAQRDQLSNDGFDSYDDSDNFIVYSDDIYADIDGDLYPEFPVSRIPDGRKAQMLRSALQATLFVQGTTFGIRNTARPFAETTYKSLPGSSAGGLNICERFGPADICSGFAHGAVYYMLHGADSDATRFWGETAGGLAIEGFRVDNVPKNCLGTIVFTGCCWGALAGLPTAAGKSASTEFRPRSPEQSIALSYLAGGANAFVGCTGSHYSPDKPPFNYFGKPMHELFWKGVSQSEPPALALFEAKKKYAASIPHGLKDSFSLAVELKILRQYTCLGIGW